METYKLHLIDMMIRSKLYDRTTRGVIKTIEPALKFGDFTLKSGRKSPFFLNMGAFKDGELLKELAVCYADAIVDRYGMNFDILFGPAYKGIPLAASTAMVLSDNYNLHVDYSANRKEEKDHGDGGIFLGATPQEGSRVVIIEDVTTSGASMRETVPLLQSRGAEIVGLMVALDRNEYGTRANITALDEVSQEFGFPTAAIVSMPEVIGHLTEIGYLSVNHQMALDRYYDTYGVKR